jgi:hypothetical protein
MAGDVTLASILGQGHPASPDIDLFEQLAAKAHAHRLNNNRADRPALNRSTSLWALKELSPRVDDALRAGNVDPLKFARMLGLRPSLRDAFLSDAAETSQAPPPALDVDLARAVQAYVSGLPPGESVGLEHLAIAILQSAASDGSGMLPRRLAQLGIDYPRTLGELRRGIGTQEAAQEVGFSRSVDGARGELGDDTSVTAASLAAAIQRQHREYAEGAFGTVTLRVDRGPRKPVADWLTSVRELYEPSDLLRTGYQVIDGQLVVLALAELDDSLADDLLRGGVLERWRRAVNLLPHSVSTDRTSWMDDAPAEKDELGRDKLAEVLARRMRVMATPERSVLVHLDGPWGAGKSTLLNFLEDELRTPTEVGGQAFLVVQVNAWREEQVGVQWWSLHQSLRRAVEADARGRSRWRGAGAWLRNRWDAAMARRSLVLTIGPALLLVLVGVGVLLFGNLDDRNATVDFWGKTLSLVAVSMAGIVAVYRFLVPASRDAANTLVAKSANPMDDVRRMFARTLKRASKPVVFVIDDLDRCDSRYVVEFLQALQTLVRDPIRTSRMPSGPHGIVAADGGWIRSSYEHEYSALPVHAIPGRPLGYQFLEKIFQLRVRLPSISTGAQQQYFESLLRPPGSADDVRGDKAGADETREESGGLVDELKEEIKRAKTGDDLSRVIRKAKGVADARARMEVLGAAALQSSEPALLAEARHQLVRFSRFLEPNPRNIKLFVNTYGTLQALLAFEGTQPWTTRLARWTIVEIRWPELADHLRVSPDDLDERPGRTMPAAITSLLADNEVKAVLGGGEWPAFSPEDVRACTGAASAGGAEPAALEQA